MNKKDTFVTKAVNGHQNHPAKKEAQRLYDLFKPLVSQYDEGSEEPVSYEYLNRKNTRKAVTILVNEKIKEFQEMGRTNIAGIQFPTRIEYWQEVLFYLKNTK